MANNPNNMKNLVPFNKGKSGNPKGRPKGSKSLSSIIREFENEEFDWSKFPKGNKQLNELIKEIRPLGSPFRAIVYKALIDAVQGNSAAREWLTKAAYGNKIESQTEIERSVEAPIIRAKIKPRFNNTNNNY